MKVVHILNELKPSGAEVMLRSAAARFRQCGIDEAVILTTGAQPGIFAPELERAGYRIEHLPFARSPGFFLRLRKRLRAINADVVHTHVERAHFWIGLTILAAGYAGAVRTFHQTFPHDGLLRRVRGWQRRALHRLGIRGVAISPSVQANEAARFGSPTRIVNNWYDSDLFRPPQAGEREAARRKFLGDRDASVLLSVGNCNAAKNHMAIVGALPRIAANGPFLYLHAGTETAAREEFERVRALGFADQCRFLGPVRDVRELCFAADVFVMPSIYEGFGIAAAEALASGVACVFSDGPGLVDFRDQGLDIAYCGTDASSVGQAVCDALASSPQGRAARSQANAGRTRERYGIEQGVDGYLGIYRELLHSRRRAARRPD